MQTAAGLVRIMVLTVIGFLAGMNSMAESSIEVPWLAGVARVDITPQEPMWMAGFAARDQPSESVLHPLWVKALALQDGEGNQVVLVTSDLLGFPKNMSDRIRDQIESVHGMGRAQIILSASHTHGGPVVGDTLRCMYPIDDKQEDAITRYTTLLENQIITLVGDALNALEPAALYSGNGIARIAVNSRNNEESEMTPSTMPVGPSDHAVPVLSVMREDGSLAAIIFGYACHPTVLTGYQWNGDYVGFAQIALEEAWPGATAMFFAGCGGDQRAFPRTGRTVARARQYGNTLAAAVTCVLEEPMRPLYALLRTAYAETMLDLEAAPGIDDIRNLAMNTGGYEQLCYQWMLELHEAGGSMPTAWPVPVQLWWLGDQPIVAIGGEVTVDYALRVKERLGNDCFVMGYANDVMAYLPSERVLEEGGYEGRSAQLLYGMPGAWKPGLETRILDTVDTLIRETK